MDDTTSNRCYYNFVHSPSEEGGWEYRSDKQSLSASVVSPAGRAGRVVLYRWCLRRLLVTQEQVSDLITWWGSHKHVQWHHFLKCHILSKCCKVATWEDYRIIHRCIKYTMVSSCHWNVAHVTCFTTMSCHTMVSANSQYLMTRNASASKALLFEKCHLISQK